MSMKESLAGDLVPPKPTWAIRQEYKNHGDSLKIVAWLLNTRLTNLHLTLIHHLYYPRV